MPDISPRSLWQIYRLDPHKYRWYVGRGLARLTGSLIMGLLLGMHLALPDDWVQVLAAVFVSLIASVLLRYHLRHTILRTATPRAAERLTWINALLGVFGVQAINLLTKGATGPEAFVLIAPLAAQAMLTAALLGPGLGITGLTLTMVLLGMFGVIPLEVLTTAWLAGAVGSHTVAKLKKRSDLFRALSIQICTNVLLVVGASIALSRTTMFAFESTGWAILAAVGGLSVFWFGVAVIERIFGIVSDWSLLELCSPDNPLLSDLNLKAPGTYAHSIGVGTLAEAAAREIGANPVLCRALAYYHDIGKTARPSYFVENQSGENVHDSMPASLSAKVISAHVKDGIEMAQKAKLPKIIIDGIEQHHGKSLISYFYHRALNEPDAENIDQEKFRYDGPKPQSAEAGILHLADMAEAAGRSFSTRAGLDKVVNELIDATIADGQLDECTLTFKDIETIRHSFVRSLSASKHERVAYPGQIDDEQQDSATDRDKERVKRAIEA